MINPEVIALEAVIGSFAYYYHENADISQYNRQLLIALGLFSLMHIIFQLYEYYLELRKKQVCKDQSEECIEQYKVGVTPQNLLSLFIMALFAAAVIHIYYEEHRGYAVGITLSALIGITIEGYLLIKKRRND